MTVLILIFLAAAAVGLVLSIVTTVRLFKGFSAEESAEERIARLKKYRTQMMITYALTVGFVTAAAVVKLLG